MTPDVHPPLPTLPESFFSRIEVVQPFWGTLQETQPLSRDFFHLQRLTRSALLRLSVHEKLAESTGTCRGLRQGWIFVWLVLKCHPFASQEKAATIPWSCLELRQCSEPHFLFCLRTTWAEITALPPYSHVPQDRLVNLFSTGTVSLSSAYLAWFCIPSAWCSAWNITGRRKCLLSECMNGWYLQPLYGSSSFNALPYHSEYPRVVKLAQTLLQSSSDADSDCVFFRRIRNGCDRLWSLQILEREKHPEIICPNSSDLNKKKEKKNTHTHKMICCTAWNTSHSL